MSNAKMMEKVEKELYHLPVNMISPNPYQPRRIFDSMQLVELAQSIRQHGVMQPITVRMTDGGYELVAGERRLRASILADISTIPAIIVDVDDNESALLAMIENLQRADLNYIEEAEGFAAIIEQTGLTQEEVAKKIGRNQSTVANKLRLLRLSRSIKKLLLENGLSERHARALLKIDKSAGFEAEEAEKLQAEAIARIIKEDMTVKKAEEMIERLIAKPVSETPAEKPKLYIKDIRIFTNTIKHAVRVIQDSGMAAEYDIEETDNGCFITVAVNYK